MKRMKCLINTTMERLKKALPFIGIILFTSCTSVQYLISTEDMQEQIAATINLFEEKGYEYIGSETSSNNTLYVDHWHYNYTTGTKNSVLNNLQSQQATFNFVNPQGYTAEFSVLAYPKAEGIYKAQVTSCKVTQPNLYNTLCNSTEIQTLNNLPREYEYRYISWGKTTLILTIPLLIALPFLLII